MRNRTPERTAPIFLGALLASASLSATPSLGPDELVDGLLGKEFSGTPWVFESIDEFSNFDVLREERRGEFTEYFVYMSLIGERACHNTLALISVEGDEVLSADMVHHAPAKRCLSYTEFKNP